MKQPTLEFDVDPLLIPVVAPVAAEPVKEIVHLAEEETKTVTALVMPVVEPIIEQPATPEIQSVASKASQRRL